MSHFADNMAAILGEESGFIFNEETQEDFERSDALRGLMNDIRDMGSTISLPFEGDDDYITLEAPDDDLEYNDAFDDDGLVVTYQQNRADAYAYAAAACAQQERTSVPPRVDWKREGF